MLLHSPDIKPALACFLAAEEVTLAIGAALGRALQRGTRIYLTGELGVGKTTLTRGTLRGLGYTGRVKSPTFALVEVYKISSLYFYHFDFYRFDDVTELESTGFREYFGPDAVCVVEWPEKVTGLPQADLRIEMRVTGAGRTFEARAYTEAGRLCLNRVRQANDTG